MSDVKIKLSPMMAQAANVALSNCTVKDSRVIMRMNKAVKKKLADTCTFKQKDDKGNEVTLIRESDMTLETTEWEYLYDCGLDILKAGFHAQFNDGLEDLFTALETVIDSLKPEVKK